MTDEVISIEALQERLKILIDEKAVNDAKLAEAEKIKLKTEEDLKKAREINMDFLLHYGSQPIPAPMPEAVIEEDSGDRFAKEFVDKANESLTSFEKVKIL